MVSEDLEFLLWLQNQNCWWCNDKVYAYHIKEKYDLILVTAIIYR